MSKNNNFDEVFQRLRQIMFDCAKELDCKKDIAGELYLDTFHIMKNKKPLFFGAVKINKNYVSYHLMPVYVNPKLLDDVSESLRKHMQGKSCFNFKEIDEKLFKELGGLTIDGYNFYREEDYIS